MQRILVAMLVLALTGCDPGAREAEPFAGIWEAEGWGTHLLIQGGSVEIFESSDVHCLSVAGGAARGITDVLSFEGDRLLMQDSDREIRFDRVDVLPIECARTGRPSDSGLVATILTATIDEQYSGDLDPGWEGRRAELLRQSGTADGDALFDVLVDAIEPFGGRIRLAGPETTWPPLPVLTPPEGTAVGGAGGYAVGEIRDGLAYLGLSRTGPFDADPEQSQRIAGRIVDQAIRSDVVILDLRSSSGGVLGDMLLIATRFVPEPRLVARLEARAGDGAVPAGDLLVTPVPTGVFDGPVLVLIGPETRGVGELLAHVLGTLDTTTLIGAPTAGDPGPPLVRSLSNGWSVAVPNLWVRDRSGGEIGPIQPDVVSDDPLAEAIERAR